MNDSEFKRELDNWITREPEWEEEHDEDDPMCPCPDCAEERDEFARDEAIDRKKDGGW